MKIPYYKQATDYYCGPASMQMVFDYFGKYMSQKTLARELKTQSDDGTDHNDMIRVAVENGMYCYVNQESTLNEILYFLSRKLPVIVNFIEPSEDDAHYAVVAACDEESIVLNDPWNGDRFQMQKEAFLDRWYDTENRARQWMMVLSTDDLRLGKQFLPKA